MARLFTVPFQYQEQTYTAVVSLTHCNGTSTATIQVPDESLHPILQGSTVTFDTWKGLPIDYPAFTKAQELLIAILVAIEQHDQSLKLTANLNQSL
jgi:hypothetical protein